LTFDEHMPRPLQMPPWTRSTSVGYLHLPDATLAQRDFTLARQPSFQHGALSARPVGTRTTIAATQVEIATQFPVLPFAQPMESLRPDRDLLSKPADDAPRFHAPMDAVTSRASASHPSMPATRSITPLASRRADAQSSPEHLPPNALVPPPRASGDDYGAFIWQPAPRP
jgi:hypothetical protein